MPARAGQESAARPIPDRISSFPLLVRHFFGRFFDNEALSPQADPAANLGPLLGLLAAPGAFFCLLIQTLTLSGWAMVTFRYFFVAYSMVVMAFLVVFKWDALYPDRRDYHILTPLPLRPVSMFAAKLVALGILLAIFLVDINLFAAFFWPGIDRGTGYAHIIGAHLAAVSAAGLFGALAAAAIQGVLVTLFSGATLRRVSAVVQTVLMSLLVMLLCITPLISHMMHQLAASNSPIMYGCPPIWFVGLYERFRPATNHPLLLETGGIAVRALALAAIVFAVSYLPAYRWQARKFLETPSSQLGGPGRLRVFVARVLNRLVLRSPVERAVFHFITETITRSMKHRLFLSSYTGFGVALALISLDGGRTGRLRLPLTLSFIMISALRAAFNVPSELRANWAFQLSETKSAAEYLSAMRKWIVLCALLPLFGAMLVVDLRWSSAWEALFHFVYGMALSLLLTEIMFTGFCKVPFTSSYFPGSVNLVGLSAIYIFGFTTYSRLMSYLEAWLTSRPVPALVFVTGAIAVVAIVARIRAQHLHTARSLTYEDPGEPTVRELGLAN